MTESHKDREQQLRHLYRRQHGNCHICGESAILDGQGGKAGHPLSAVRFRVGSGFGEKGKPRQRVMTHRKCAQARSDQIQDSILVEERWARSGRHPTEFYSAPTDAEQ